MSSRQSNFSIHRAPLRCTYCGRPFPTKVAISHHISKTAACEKERQEEFRQLQQRRPRKRQRTSSESHGSSSEDSALQADSAWRLEPGLPDDHNIEFNYAPCTAGQVEHSESNQSTAMPPRRATVEEVEDPDSSNFQCLGMPFDRRQRAGEALQRAATAFEQIRDDQVLREGEVWGPFASEREWELARWLIKNVGHNQAEAFLKLAIVSKMSATCKFKHRTYKRLVTDSRCCARLSEQRPAISSCRCFTRWPRLALSFTYSDWRSQGR